MNRGVLLEKILMILKIINKCIEIIEGYVFFNAKAFFFGSSPAFFVGEDFMGDQR